MICFDFSVSESVQIMNVVLKMPNVNCNHFKTGVHVHVEPARVNYFMDEPDIPYTVNCMLKGI